jgi:hypothetical protein
MMACSEDEPLQKAMACLGWTETPSSSKASVAFNVCNPSRLKLDAGIIFSRFPNMADCCRKALFSTLLCRIQKLLPPSASLNDGRFIPKQWALPRDAALLQADVDAARAAALEAPGGARPLYIVKPDAGCQGQGIEITPEPSRQSPYKREAVVQEYIGRPLLLDGLKFDLRLYVLVTSVGGDADNGPMRCFLCREGMARFAVEPFDGADVRSVHAHLTNYSLNKKSGSFVATDEADGGCGSKRTVSSTFAALVAAGLVADVEGLWGRIGALVTRGLSVMQPVLASSRCHWSANPCFQILGFDVLLDEACEPWLIEINDHPSLRIDREYGAASHGGQRAGLRPSAEYDTELSRVDERIKVPMLADALRIVAGIHNLSFAPREAGAGVEELLALMGGAQPSQPLDSPAAGTSFVELTFEDEQKAIFDLFDRMRYTVEWHTPDSLDRLDPGHASRGTLLNTQTLPGPRSKANVLVAFMQSAAGIGKSEGERIFQTVCGKGGSMDLLDFADAVLMVGAILRGRQEHLQSLGGVEAPAPFEVITGVLDRWQESATARAPSEDSLKPKAAHLQQPSSSRQASARQTSLSRRHPHRQPRSSSLHGGSRRPVKTHHTAPPAVFRARDGTTFASKPKHGAGTASSGTSVSRSTAGLYLLSNRWEDPLLVA